jgi:hypothetical protein
MNWLEKNTKKGVLKYRMPNIVEGFEFLSMIEAIKTSGDFYRVKGKFIAGMSCLLDYSALGYDGYDKLLEDKENMLHPMSEIAQEVFNDITGALAKKD